MKERILIRDRDGNLVNDPERAVEDATGLRWATMWPKGYGEASFTVRRDIVTQWAVKQAYEMLVYDGQRIVYQGRLSGLGREMRGTGEQINLTATGWYSVLVERLLRKRWADNAALSRFEAATNSSTQRSFPVDKRENFLQVRMSAEDNIRGTGQRYIEQYDMPAGDVVRRVTYNYAIETGESVFIGLYNGTPTVETSVTNDTSSGAVDRTMGTPTQRISLRLGPGQDETFDQNDWGTVENVTCYSELGTIDAKAVIEDVLQLLAPEISTDYSQIANPGLEIVPFMTENDDYENGDSIIQRAASYGDSSLRTWGFSVWSSFGTTDGRPRGEFTYRDDTQPEDYRVRLNELASFSDADSDDEIYNNIIVKFRDQRDKTIYRTATDNAALADADSIARYGRRDYTLDIGTGDATRADYQGRRFLEYHRLPLRKTSFSIYHQIRNATGIYVPASWVKAGKWVRVEDYNGGEMFFLRRTEYDAETGELTMQPDLPPDDMVVYLLQQGLKK